MAKVLAVIAMILVMGANAPGWAAEVRVKDLVNVRGVRTNQLIGFGVVVGLAGSGDSKKALSTNSAISSMLTKLGVQTKAEDVVAGNVAGVVVTADLPAFARMGDQIDVKVSTVGDAKSLAGGTLILTPLRAGDGNVYGVAQGSLAVGQASGQGTQILTVARVAKGATIEREFRPNLATDGKLVLSLENPDFTTNMRISDAINRYFRGFYATSLDPVSLEVKVPKFYQSRLVEFISELESLTVQTDAKAIVVLNERTGTIVLGGSVRIEPISISHGKLSIRVDGKSGGESADQAVVNIPGTTIADLVGVLNRLGVTPDDLVSILQAIHSAGALHAELKML